MRYLKNTPWWAMSIIVHTIALFFLWQHEFRMEVQEPTEVLMGITILCGPDCGPCEIELPDVIVPAEETPDDILVELVEAEDGDAVDYEPLAGDNDIGLESTGELGTGYGRRMLWPAVSSGSSACG